MKFRIKTKTKKERQAAIVLVQKFTGYPINGTNSIRGDGVTVESVDRMNMDYPYIFVDNKNTVCGSAQIGNDIIFDYATQLPEIIAAFIKPPKVYEMSNVGDYVARITEKGIVVGCQTIKFEKFQELVELVAEYAKDHA